MVNFQALYLPVSKIKWDNTFKACCVRSAYSTFIVQLFLLVASCGSRGSACSQDSGSNMGHLGFVQIWAKWNYKTIFAAWVYYKQKYNILELEKKKLNFRGKHQFCKKWARGIKRTNGKEHTMKTQPTLPSSPGHLSIAYKMSKFHIYYTLRDTRAFVSALRTAFSCEQFSIVCTNMGRTSTTSVNFCMRFLLFWLHTISITM